MHLDLYLIAAGVDMHFAQLSFRALCALIVAARSYGLIGWVEHRMCVGLVDGHRGSVCVCVD